MSRKHIRTSWSTLATVGVALMLLFAAGAIGFSGGVAGQEAETAERTIENTELAPGESTTVTVDIELTGDAGPALAEEFSTPFADVQRVGEEPFATVAGSTDANDEYSVLWEEQGSSYTAEYTVTVPEDAEDGDEFVLDGNVTVGDNDATADVTGDDTITVVEPEETGDVEVEVFNESDNEAVEDAEIQLLDDTGNQVGSTLTTDEAGFASGSYAAGDYELVVEADGYESFSTSVSIEADEVTPVSAGLTPETDDGSTGAEFGERTIDSTTLAPGESTEVTVAIETDEQTGPFLLEQFDPGFESVDRVGEEPFAQIAGANDANTEYTAGWPADGTTYEATYEVTVPENASDGDEYAISGEVEIDDKNGTVAGDDTITVQEDPRAPYASDGGVVDAPGLSNAFDDWKQGEINAQLLSETFDAWQSGNPIF